MAEPIGLTIAQAQAILDGYHGDRDNSAPVASLAHLDYGYSPGTTTYLIRLKPSSAPAASTHLLVLSHPPKSEEFSPDPSPSYEPNTLDAQHRLLSQLHSDPSIPPLPFPKPLSLSTSPTDAIPYHYLLLSLPSSSQSLTPLSIARQKGLLSEQQKLALDLRLGAHLKQLHAVENDWFGPPALESDALFSWQEAFTLMLEEVLTEAETLARGGNLGLELELPADDIRTALSRGIGGFIFDDVEVPSFVWVSGSEDDVLLDIPSDPGEADANAQDRDVHIAAFLHAPHALWGDPLLERLLRHPKPSAAMWEGYGGDPVVFGKQETKMLWYDLYEALVTLVRAARVGAREEEERVRWAKVAVERSVAALKEARNY
ncbi:hypothetical protein EVG20_g10475 [Dentipellis fragilis]|uniref:Aminoglycoside phosphotransferase domain-containing protein n=1 Tax=Dentipellis fragilis TaxID=205917 RepID=A0A4Y9XQN4_9AGAM|nr:hypothetical protein EVG20_g10475 [Dentipellis fragilis]